jgi:hypothetical protein
MSTKLRVEFAVLDHIVVVTQNPLPNRRNKDVKQDIVIKSGGVGYIVNGVKTTWGRGRGGPGEDNLGINYVRR